MLRISVSDERDDTIVSAGPRRAGPGSVLA